MPLYRKAQSNYGGRCHDICDGRRRSEGAWLGPQLAGIDLVLLGYIRCRETLDKRHVNNLYCCDYSMERAPLFLRSFAPLYEPWILTTAQREGVESIGRFGTRACGI